MSKDLADNRETARKNSQSIGSRLKRSISLSQFYDKGERKKPSMPKFSFLKKDEDEET